MNSEIPLVSVVCTTFNHESYIRPALDGFVIQQCNFPIEVIVHDDASTDNTVAIIQEYVAKYPFIRAILQTENQYSKGFNIWGYLFEKETKGKYIALCEGDDYWTDPYKLQKQVDFLEANEDFAICFHPVKIRMEEEDKIVDDFITPNVFDVTDIYQLAGENYIQTVTVVFKTNSHVFDEFNKMKNLAVGDYVLHMLNAQYGKIKKLNDCMAVYRMHNGGIWAKKEIEYTYPKSIDLLDSLKSVISGDGVKQIIDGQKGRIALDLCVYYLKKNEYNLSLQYYIIAMECAPNTVFDLFQRKYYALQSIKKSKAYRLGKCLLRPFALLKSSKNH